MPYSAKQRSLFAIAEHHPEKLYPKNRRLAKLPHKTLHDFASGPLHKAKQLLRRRR